MVVAPSVAASDAVSAAKTTATVVAIKFADLMVAAFGFVAALAWNDAVGSLFKPGGRLQFLNGGVWMYAAFVTLLALGVTYWRTRFVPPDTALTAPAPTIAAVVSTPPVGVAKPPATTTTTTADPGPAGPTGPTGPTGYALF